MDLDLRLECLRLANARETAPQLVVERAREYLMFLQDKVSSKPDNSTKTQSIGGLLGVMANPYSAEQDRLNKRWSKLTGGLPKWTPQR